VVFESYASLAEPAKLGKGQRSRNCFWLALRLKFIDSIDEQCPPLNSFRDGKLDRQACEALREFLAKYRSKFEVDLKVSVRAVAVEMAASGEGDEDSIGPIGTGRQRDLLGVEADV